MKSCRKMLVVLVSIFFVFSVFSSSVSAIQSGRVIFDYSWNPGTMAINERAVSTGEKLIVQRFVKYLTPSWTYSPNYTWSKSVSVGLGFSPSVSYSVANSVAVACGFNLSYTTNFAVATVTLADPTRLSKLAFFSDYQRQYLFYELRNDGKVTLSYNGYVDAPTDDTYILPKYKT